MKAVAAALFQRFQGFPKKCLPTLSHSLNIRPLATQRGAAKADAARVAGSTGRVGAAKLARWLQQKKIAETVDETKKALHNLVSLLQTTQRAERQSR
ncbi:hypothetical protein [Cupriavidus sp. amp6]|uniref:hypothetical protein n=1 Tax=Cupriavidus sp. amp6 TaxID=388051 RepID=UPI0012EB3368|nr:hypothetical protein [Cupriavidus sp. amp6]